MSNSNYFNLYACEYEIPTGGKGIIVAYAPTCAPVHVDDDVIVASGVKAKVRAEVFVMKDSDICNFINLLIDGKPIRITEKIHHEKINYHDEQEGD